jgi:hypothetical protein
MNYQAQIALRKENLIKLKHRLYREEIPTRTQSFAQKLHNFVQLTSFTLSYQSIRILHINQAVDEFLGHQAKLQQALIALWQ